MLASILACIAHYINGENLEVDTEYVFWSSFHVKNILEGKLKINIHFATIFLEC